MAAVFYIDNIKIILKEKLSNRNVGMICKSGPIAPTHSFNSQMTGMVQSSSSPE